MTSSTSAAPGLLRVLGLSFGVAVVVGDVIGSGILRTPGIVAGALPDARLILLAWALGGLITLIDAMATIELASALPRAGGPYVYVRRAFGSLAGFLTGWTDWLAQIASTAYIAVAFAEYLQRLDVLGGMPTGAIAALLALLLGGVNALGTRIGGATQTIGSALKGLGLLALTVAVLSAPGSPLAGGGPATTGAITLGSVIVAMRAIYGSYGGWNTPTYFAEEITDPERNLSRAIIGGILLTTLLYLMVNVALLHALPVEAIAASKLPVADAAVVAFGPAGVLVVTLVALLIVLTLANLQTMFPPRLLFALARDRLLPGRLIRVDPRGTPQAALWLSAAAAAALASIGVYETLLAIYAPLIALTHALVSLSAIRLRRTEPDLPRPFRMPGGVATAWVGLAINIALVIAFTVEDWESSRWALAMLVVPLPLYLWSRRRFG